MAKQANCNTPANRMDAPGVERRNDHGDFLERMTERSPPSCVSRCYQQLKVRAARRIQGHTSPLLFTSVTRRETVHVYDRLGGNKAYDEALPQPPPPKSVRTVA